jgi:hypothetical protein
MFVNLEFSCELIETKERRKMIIHEIRQELEEISQIRNLGLNP